MKEDGLEREERGKREDGKREEEGGRGESERNTGVVSLFDRALKERQMTSHDCVCFRYIPRNKTQKKPSKIK